MPAISHNLPKNSQATSNHFFLNLFPYEGVPPFTLYYIIVKSEANVHENLEILIFNRLLCSNNSKLRLIQLWRKRKKKKKKKPARE